MLGSVGLARVCWTLLVSVGLALICWARWGLCLLLLFSDGRVLDLAGPGLEQVRAWSRSRLGAGPGLKK